MDTGRFITTLLRMNERVIERTTPKPVQGPIDPALVPWSATLEAKWTQIRDEYDALIADGTVLPRLADLVATDPYDATARANENGGSWTSFVLYSTGYRIDRNCAWCPTTVALVEAIPGMTSALFSVFVPHTFLPEHRAPNRGSMRYQLALKIPEPAGSCRIRIGETMFTWTEGKSLLFDHSVLHEAWNDSDEPRVVLFLETVSQLPLVARPINALAQKFYGYYPNARGVRQRLEEFEASQSS